MLLSSKAAKRGLLVAGLLAISAPTLAAGSGGEGGGGLGQQLISPNPGIFIWTLVTFLVVFLVLRRVAWGPLLGGLEAREKTIQDALDASRKDRDEAARLLKEHQELVAEARKERAAALEGGQREAEQLKAEILDEARGQRDQLLKQTQEQIEASTRQAKSELRAMVVDLSIQAAGKLMSKSMDDSTQRQLVETYLNDLEQGGGSSARPS